jgi:hypothetical protein
MNDFGIIFIAYLALTCTVRYVKEDFILRAFLIALSFCCPAYKSCIYFTIIITIITTTVPILNNEDKDYDYEVS